MDIDEFQAEAQLRMALEDAEAEVARLRTILSTRSPASSVEHNPIRETDKPIDRCYCGEPMDSGKTCCLAPNQ